LLEVESIVNWLSSQDMESANESTAYKISLLVEPRESQDDKNAKNRTVTSSSAHSREIRTSLTSRQAFDAKEASPEERHQSAQHQKLAKFFGEENIDYVAVSKSISVSAVKRASPPPFTSSTTQDTMPSIQRTTPAVELILISFSLS